MKQRKVWVRWPEGLHLRAASRLVAAARQYRSTIRLQHRGRVADARSILAVLMLGASFGAPLDLEVSGEDEDAAVAGITALFETKSSAAGTETIYRAPPASEWRERVS